MKLQEYINKDNKLLRCGYTTGSCACAAAKAAVIMLLGKTPVRQVSLTTPKGIPLTLEITDIEIKNGSARCAVQKDAGDDPDVTDGMKIFACVTLKKAQGITIDGGEGIGRVTKPGLDQPVGNAAINSTPRKMISTEVQRVCAEYNYRGGVEVIICAPQGKEAALKTFNPRLGIEGGISILGTSGIVEPMSDEAVIATVQAEINQRKALGKKYAVIAPGNFGQNFLFNNFSFSEWDVIKCGNFIGETALGAERAGLLGLLLAGHIGKIIKIAGNMMNTHSRYGDCRAEIFAAHAALCGMNVSDISSIMNAATTDEMLAVAEKSNLGKKISESIVKKAHANLCALAPGIRIGIVCYSFGGVAPVFGGAAEEIAAACAEEI